jgi:hypothetical protein
MNRILRVYCLAAATFLTSIVLAVAFTSQYQPFTGDQGAVPGLGNPATWTYATGCSNDIVYAPTNTTGSWSLNVPVFHSATNDLTDQIGSATKVWTDFWTVPVRYSAENYPAIDTNATAQVYMNASSNWVAYSGTGSGGFVTNELLATTTASLNGYYQVSILSDYGAKKYSLFINDNCIGTNLNFISTNTAAATDAGSNRWFIVQNLGGTTPCLFDEYRFTTNMSGVLTNTVAGGGISQSDALMLFGTTAPKPVATNAAILGTQVAWKFRVEGEGESIVLGGTTTNSITTSNGVLNASGQFTNDMASVSKYFYKIIRKSADSSVTITNAEVYAAYKQGRTTNKTYIVGAPVDIIDGDRTVGGVLGRQLAKGLGNDGSAPDTMTVYSNGIPYQFTWQAGGTWSGEGLSLVIGPGQGVVIEKHGATSNTVVAGLLPTNSITPIALVNGFNVLSWPYESVGSLSNFSGLTSSDIAGADYIYLQNGTDAVAAARKVSLTEWKTGIRVGGGTNYNPVLNAGAGIYLFRHGADAVWTPVP